jgi:hypothetical protein
MMSTSGQCTNWPRRIGGTLSKGESVKTIREKREKMSEKPTQQFPTQQFTDAEKREWLIDLDIPTVERVLKTTGFDLYRGLDPANSQKLDGEPDLFFRVIFEILREQADARKLTIDDFKKACGKNMDVVEAAGDCLVEALVNFSPSRRRPLLRQMREKTMALQAATLELAQKRIDQLNPETRAKELMENLDHPGRQTQVGVIHVQQSSSSPESVESTRVPAD